VAQPASQAPTYGGANAYGDAATTWQPSPDGRSDGVDFANPQAAFTRPSFSGADLIGGGTQMHPAMAPPNPFGVGNYDQSQPSTLQAPGQNMANPGYSEQGVEAIQNRLLQDPYADQMQDQYQQTQNPSAGEDYINKNLGTLDGPGQGEQYWQQQQGQFNGPGQGSEFTKNATNNFDPNGPSSAFNDKAQGQYDDFTGYQGAGNSQGQYDANAAYGPNSSQQFNDQMQGSFDEMGRYNDPNLAAGQYQQTQGAFGDMPIAQFDPFYDRARQLGVQSYNQDAAGRGVYGSSEALSGVGNVITDIEAQRANRSFDAEMQRTQEQRMRQQLLGEQARAGDLSSVAGHAAGLAGIETYGNLANQAAGQTTAQQTMLGNQANDADDNAQAAQDSNIRGVDVLGGIANNADARQTDRYRETTNAMTDAQRADTERSAVGANIADMADDNARGDYDSSNAAAVSSANVRDQRIDTGIQAGDVGSDNDLAHLSEFGDQTGQAEDDRQARVQSEVNSVMARDARVADAVGNAQENLMGADRGAFEDAWNAKILPALQASGMSVQEQAAFRQTLMDSLKIGVSVATQD
jgi:hypothetical protein